MWSTEQQPFIMGILVSVIVGIALTIPISSAAICAALSLTGLAGGAAVAGCCAQMIGFAVMSFPENKFGGLISQGLGTSMLQVPNIVRKPIIWLPAIVSSAILAPVSTMLLKMVSNPVGSGMGSAGLVGQFMSYDTMVAAGVSPVTVLLEIIVMHFILPAVVSLAIAEAMRKMGLIKNGDLKLEAANA